MCETTDNVSVINPRRKQMRIFVGHGSYSGANALRVHKTTHGAVIDLIRRGVRRDTAREKVNQATAYPYPHITMTTANGLQVIEVGVREE
jgi:hypothetical protein